MERKSTSEEKAARLTQADLPILPIDSPALAARDMNSRQHSLLQIGQRGAAFEEIKVEDHDGNEAAEVDDNDPDSDGKIWLDAFLSNHQPEPCKSAAECKT